MDLQGVKHSVHSAFKGAVESVIPPRSSSGGFLTHGVLNPDEFVASGDFLVQTCPTWHWVAGQKQSAKSYLPADKQFLVTRNVPCYRRPAALERAVNLDGIEGGADDDWLAPTLVREASSTKADDDVPDISDVLAGASLHKAAMVAPGLQADAEDEGVLLPSPGNILRTRSYDVSITYDKYYQTPRIWLVGWSEHKQPLSADQCLEDVSVEHAGKTVTIDAHPHTGVRAVSIHPCKHAAVMKSLAAQLSAGGREAPRTEHFLVIFLRFCQTAMPTIDYDFTVAM